MDGAPRMDALDLAVRLARRYDCPTLPQAQSLRDTFEKSPLLRAGPISALQIIHDSKGYAVTTYAPDDTVNDEPAEGSSDTTVIYEWVLGRDLN